MNFLLRLAAVWTSVAMLASANFSYADDLENLITTRQHVLNQFNDNANVYGNTRQATPVHPVNTHPAPSNNTRAPSGNADELIGSAMGLLGVAYRYGGTSASTGFDCSGFMQHIFKRAMGVNLPRTSAEQAQMGVAVSRSELQPGDMVFFRTMGPGRISHVGLYIGNNNFIHAPRTGKRIEITSLGHKSWSAKYAFGRRVKKNDPSRFLN